MISANKMVITCISTSRLRRTNENENCVLELKYVVALTEKYIHVD
jgi:hypothetical protein